MPEGLTQQQQQLLAAGFPTAKPGFKFTLRFNEGIQGWTENVYLSYDVPDLAVAATDLAAFMSDLANNPGGRLNILTSSASVISVRISSVSQTGTPIPGQGGFLCKGQPDDGGAFLPPDFPTSGTWTGFGKKTDSSLTPTPPWDSILVNVRDATQLYQASHEIRGVPQMTKVTPGGNPVLIYSWNKLGLKALTSNGDTLMNKWTFYLSNNSGAGTGLVGRFAIYGKSKNPTQTTPMKIIGAVPAPASVGPPNVPAGCYTQITSQADGVAPAWRIGDTVHLRNITGCGSAGLNGDAKVITNPMQPIVGSTLPWVTVVARLPCCCGPYTIGSRGIISLNVYGLFDAASAIPSVLTSRKTGAAGGGTRGRARKRCRA